MMRKITSFITLTIMLLSIFAVSAFAEAAPSITVGTVTGKKGETVEIPVVLEDNTGFCNLGIEIGYDSTKLKLISAVGNSAVGNVNFVTAQNITQNPYNLVWNSVSNTTFCGTLATLSFEILTDARGTYPITIDYYKGRNGDYVDGDNVNYDENYAPVHFSYVNGSVTVKKEASGGSLSVSGIAFKVKLDGDTAVGNVYAAMYDADGLICAKIYPAAESVDVVFDAGITGDYVKIMWWDGMAAVCRVQKIPLK